MSSLYPEEPLDPLYPTTDTDYLPASPTVITSSQVVPLVAFSYDQPSPAATWTITHNLNFFPNVTVIDTGGTQIEAELVYPSRNELTITFTSPVAGSAYLS